MGTLLRATPIAAQEDDALTLEQEPLPPKLLLRHAPPQHVAPIRDLITNWFGDHRKAVRARAQLVHRYHAWSIRPLVQELNSAGANAPAIQNSVLTVAALRDRWGPSTLWWPALDALQGHLSKGGEWNQAFAALALGCFHHLEAETPKPPVQPRIRDGTDAMREDMRRTTQALADLMVRGRGDVRVAAMLALAKRGGPQARRLFLDRVEEIGTAHGQSTWTALICRALQVPDAPTPFFEALATDDTLLRRASALALSVAMLAERPADLPDWTASSRSILKALEIVEESKRDAPEVIFARGVCTWRNQLQPEWKALWNIAVKPTAEDEVTIAAAQALLFCDQPWLLDAALRWPVGGGEFKIDGKNKAPLLAGLLLLAAQSGEVEALETVRPWLTNANRNPQEMTVDRPPFGRQPWDVRYHALVGLIRSLERGVVTDAAQRTAILELLRKGLRSIDRDAPLHAAIERLLEGHAKKIARDPFYRIPEEDALAVERSFWCPHGLLARRIHHVCLHRLGRMVGLLFRFDSIPPARPGETKGQQQRVLRAYLSVHPYFRHMELLLDRGTRPPARLPEGAEGIHR